MKKKLLSLALALFMVLAFLPASVMAEGTTITVNAGEDAKVNGQALIKAVKDAKTGDVITLSAGDYDITITAGKNSKNGSGLIISESITLKAADENKKPVIYGSSDEFNAGDADGKNGQSTIYVSKGNVSLENLIIMPLGGLGDDANKWQKTVEVTSGVSGFKMLNCETKPNTKVDGNSMVSSAGLVHISSNEAVLEGNSFGVGTKLCAGWADSSDSKVTTYYSYSGTNNTWAGEVSTEGVITLDGKTYVNDEVSLTQAIEKGKTDLVLANDIELSKMLTIEKKVNIDLGGHTITASGNFTHTSQNANDSHLINVESENSNVTISNGKLIATDKNKHTVNVYNGADLTLKDVTVDHSRPSKGEALVVGGAPIVINGSKVTLEGKVELIQGENSWYGINVDPKNQANATLTIANNAQIINNGKKPLVQIDGISSNNQPVPGKSVCITIKDGAKIDTDALAIVNKDSKGPFVPVNDEFVIIGNNTNLEFDENGNVVFVEPKPETPSTPVCAGSKDKNCDGVVTCDEEKGEGWTWNNELKVCEYTGKTSYTVVNTAAK